MDLGEGMDSIFDIRSLKLHKNHIVTRFTAVDSQIIIILLRILPMSLIKHAQFKRVVLGLGIIKVMCIDSGIL